MKAFLNKQMAGMRLWWLLIPLGLGIVFLIIGSFNDLAISQAIADQGNWLGMFMEGWGMVIPFVMTTIGGAALGGGLFQLEKKFWKILGIILLIVAIGVMAYQTGHYILKIHAGGGWLFYMGLGGKLIAYGIGAVINAAVGILCFFLFKTKDPENMIRIGLFIVLFVALQAGILEIIKRACYRPRYRWIAMTSYDAQGNAYVATPDMISMYRDWFANWQWFSRKGYPDVPYKDYIMSFPSGHTGMMAVVLFAPMLLHLFELKEEKRKIWEPISFAIGLILLVILAFARVLVGAHWVSDVSFATIFVSLLGIVMILINDKVKVKAKAE